MRNKCVAAERLAYYGPRARMSKLMLITARLTDPPVGGRALLSRLHHDCLKDILGDRLVVHALDRGPPADGLEAIRALGGHIDGLSPDVEEAVVDRVRTEDVRRVYLDGSNLGRLARAIKRALPAVEVLTFFHNVEARFYLGALRERFTPRTFGVLFANFYAERLAVRWSDRLIVLNRRDGDGLLRLYGRAATDLLPMAMEDRMRPVAQAGGGGPEPYLLFVGGDFYANRAGILWFAREVAPQLHLDTWVIGRGMEACRGALESHANVRVVGGVDWLDDWYRGAKAVIAPIFDGSGMKTKVAEAMMFGKRVVGTSEAFCGYEEVASQVGWICDTREEFITTLRDVEGTPLPPFDPALRAVYERFYSREATTVRLADILSRSDRSDVSALDRRSPGALS
ncbi:MAG TPA: glycosyltransferase [Allosphingosinicella sp.]|nr:glycosyltransferase [Allosphingosinicella sp.]